MCAILIYTGPSFLHIMIIKINTLMQASKNGRKPYLFPQKKFVSVFYAISIFISNRHTLIVRREIPHSFRFCLTCFLFTMIWNKNKKKMYWCPEVCIYTQKSNRIWLVYPNYSKCTWKASNYFHLNPILLLMMQMTT